MIEVKKKSNGKIVRILDETFDPRLHELILRTPPDPKTTPENPAPDADWTFTPDGTLFAEEVDEEDVGEVE